MEINPFLRMLLREMVYGIILAPMKTSAETIARIARYLTKLMR